MGLLFGDDLFLAEEIEVGLAAGPRVDDSGKISGKIIGGTVVIQRESKRELQRDLGRSDGFTVDSHPYGYLLLRQAGPARGGRRPECYVTEALLSSPAPNNDPAS